MHDRFSVSRQRGRSCSERVIRRESDLLVLGANVVDQCVEAGLVDEILIHLVPELLADGVRLFSTPRVRAFLETLDVSASGQVVNLRFRVAK